MEQGGRRGRKVGNIGRRSDAGDQQTTTYEKLDTVVAVIRSAYRVYDVPSLRMMAHNRMSIFVLYKLVSGTQDDE